MFQVYIKRCNECLFSEAKIVDEQRAADIVRRCVRSDTHFICHKSTIENNGQVCCRGFWDKHKDDVSKLQIYDRLKLVEFVELPKTNI